MKATAIIADDESPLRNYLMTLLADTWPELIIVDAVENGIDALKAIIKHQPDVAFLDINMPGLTGLEIAAQCKDDCHIVFITAYDQYAIEAFENEAIDYLLKPVTKDRLQTTRKRLQERLNNSPQDLSNLLSTLQSNQSYLQWLKVAYQEEVKLINVIDIDYFQSSEKYTSAYVNGKEYVLRSSLKKLEEQLDPNEFWRVHRATMVRVKSIESITKMLSGQLLINIGTHKLPVSRAFQNLFKQD